MTNNLINSPSKLDGVVTVQRNSGVELFRLTCMFGIMMCHLCIESGITEFSSNINIMMKIHSLFTKNFVNHTKYSKLCSKIDSAMGAISLTGND